ncbi:MAG: hypothetical protein JNL28_02630 [Planctomycetes bacterium]|nr:hypothetical protein [Planctomycetota bacterium]
MNSTLVVGARGSPWMLRGAAAFLAGASGLALQSLLVSAGGLALGYGGSVAIGLALWLAAWAVGAFCSRRSWGAHAHAPLWIGTALLVVAPASVWAVLWAGSELAGRGSALLVAACALSVPAFLQGFFLPILARGTAQVGGLFALNLLGCFAGAYGIADGVVGEGGRLWAAATAGVAGLAAGLCALAAVRASSSASVAPRAHADQLSPVRAALVVGLAVAWMSALEWLLLRLGVLWFGGMQNALNVVLCASLLALALGAACLPPLVARRRHALPTLLCVCALGSLWPFVAAPALASLAQSPVFVRALVLCGPALLGFGAVIPLVHARVAASGDSGDRLARLLLHEAWGAVLGIPLVHFVVVPQFGLNGALALGLVFGATALWAAAGGRAVRLIVVPILLLAALATQLPTPARASAPLANPAFTLLSLREDREFAVAVVDDGRLGERTLLTDGFRAAGTGREYLYMEALGHLPLLLHPAPRRVAVLALGTGTTLGSVALHTEVERIDVLEISRAVVEAAPFFIEKNHGALSEGLPGLCADDDGVARVVVRLGDGRRSLATAPDTYDVITMEPLLPDSPFAVYLYTREFYAIARRALRAGGIVCQWVPPHALEPVTFDAVLRAFGGAFEWSGVWVFGTQVVLIGAAHEPELEAARWSGHDERLDSALQRLGLGSALEVAARWCGPAPEPDASARSLSDADPWIVYRPRRRGAALLLDLPQNLAQTDAVEHALPSDWCRDQRAGALHAAAGQRALRGARRAHAFAEAELRQAYAPESTAPEFDALLAAARRLLGDDPDLARFVDEVAFVAELQRGLAALGAGSDRVHAEAARRPLIAAAKLRPERADVHLYAAVALDRAGAEAIALEALKLALELCPGLARTNEARIARQLGLSAALEARAQAEITAR